MREYEPGLHEVADGCHAYLQPGGGWGWSNAGLVVGDGGSLLVDTLFDLDLTARMLEAMAPAVLTAPIGTVVNTHANGDHCYGNQLLGGTEIVASSAAAEEMGEVPPALLAGLVAAEGEVGDLFRSFFGEFRFEGIELTLPTRTFDGRLELDVGGRAGRADRGRPGPHPGRRARPRAGRPDDLHRRHPLHRRHAHRVGRSARQLGRGVRPHPRPRRRAGRARPRSRDRQGRRGRGAGLPHVHRPGGDRPLRGRPGRVGGGAGTSPARSAAAPSPTWGSGVASA